jgi:hypothetical protein
MDRLVKVRHESHVRSNDLCAQNSDGIDVNPGAKKTRLALNDYVTESTRLIAVRDQAITERKAATRQCRLCRQGLRGSGNTIVKVARRVTLPNTVMQALTVPGQMSDEKLQAHMQALHDHVLPYKDAFEAEGLPAGALTKLTDGIKALAAARATRAATIQDAASADASLSENQGLASTAISALEAVIPTDTQANRELVTKLKVARRVGPRKAQPTAPATASTTSTTPPGAPASPALPPPPAPVPAPAKDTVS